MVEPTAVSRRARPSDAQRDTPPGRTDPGAARSEPRVVIDLTDATLARHGAPVVELGAPSAASTSPSVATAGAPVAEPVVRGARALMDAPAPQLVTLNILNVADAALTLLWIDIGIAVEANPVVDAIGFPGKIVGVAVGSYLVYRTRPRWLLVPVAALAAVCVYHVVGAVLVLGGVG